jgi:2-polyprenyl-3-methyl-5-hydroxy-6-metoxy-1,4-benzoquinol methylase
MGWLNPIPNERTFLYQHLWRFAHSMDNKVVLDVGAGCRPYARVFASHQYQSCDMEQGFFADHQHDFLASAYNIPRDDASFEVVLMLQVLEHLAEPLAALKEMNRILARDGLIFISVPQAAGDHFAPYHFYNFTQYGLKRVLSESGFEIVEHHRLSGLFCYVNSVCKFLRFKNRHKS